MHWTADSARGVLAIHGPVDDADGPRLADVIRDVMSPQIAVLDLTDVGSWSVDGISALDTALSALRGSGLDIDVLAAPAGMTGAVVDRHGPSYGTAPAEALPDSVAEPSDEGVSRLRGAFDEVSAALESQGEGPIDALLDRIVKAAVTAVDSADSASLTVAESRSRASTSAATDDLARRVDALQYEVAEGPCLDVATTTAPAAGSGDLAHSTRWARFGPRASAEGVGAVLAVGLTHGHEIEGSRLPFGALNLYSIRTYAFTEQDRDTAILLASYAGVAIESARRTAQAANLHLAIESRDVIGQAKGILMARHGLDGDQAFDVLRRTSSHLNVKLRRVAEHVTEQGSLPALPGDGSPGIP